MLNEISVEILRKCPNYCLHCSSSSSPYCSEIMAYNKFLSVVDEARKLGAKTICLSGGEPFLHKDIIEMVTYVNQAGLFCNIYTSGIILTKTGGKSSIPGSVLEKLPKKNTKLIFNIEAGTESTYDKIMGTHGCFDLMQESALRAAEIGLCTEAHFVPMALNISDIHDVLDLCRQLRISKISFLRLVLHGRARENSEMVSFQPENIARLKKYLNSLQENSDVAIRIGVPLSVDMTCRKCEAANGKLNIKYDGAVYPCEVFKNIDFRDAFGDVEPQSIYEHSLTNIYNYSEYLKNVRKMSQQFAAEMKKETCMGQYMLDTLLKGVKE